jgi:hypothetical protein
VGAPKAKTVNNQVVTLDVSYLFTLGCLLQRPLTRQEVLQLAREDKFIYIDMRSKTPLERHFRYLAQGGYVVSEEMRGSQGQTLLFSITPYGVKRFWESMKAYRMVVDRAEKSGAFE